MSFLELASQLGLTPGTALYVVVVVAIGLIAIIRTALWLNFTKRRRIHRLEAKEWFEAVLTDTPIDDPVEEARERGFENIEGNTTVTRRVLIPLIVLGTLLFAVMPFLGKIPAALISVIAAILTVIAGVAARPIAENAFAGLAIAWSRQVNIGDTVLVDEQYGTVEDITVTHTTIRLWDWRRYVVPNSKLLNTSLINLSLHDRFQWAYIEFYVGPNADLDLVERLAVRAPKESEHFAPHEPPYFWVMGMEQQGIRCWLAAWADAPSRAWSLKCDMRRSLVTLLQEHGVPVHGFRLEPEPPRSKRTARA